MRQAKFRKVFLKTLRGCRKRNTHKMAVQRFGALLSSCLVVAWLVTSGTTGKNVPERGGSHANGTYGNATLAIKPSNSCIPAHSPPPSQTTKCHPYIYRGSGICSDILGDHLINGSKRQQEHMEKLLQKLTFLIDNYKLTFGDISDKCLRTVKLGYCNHYFPRCDNTSSQIRERPVCREACEAIVQRHCEIESPRAHKINKAMQEIDSRYSFEFVNCADLPKRDGGTIPECYFPQEIKGNKSREEESDVCSYGNGQSYRGNVSVTRSGYTCQSWSSQCPHRHYRTSNNFPDLKNVSNACRNPDGQAPHGPWCYTTNRTVRWEYCNISVCSPEDAKLSEWSPFIACSVSCGGGSKTRNRTCNSARFGGKNCSSVGALMERAPCNVQNCSGTVQINHKIPQIPTYLGLTFTEIIIVSTSGSVLLLLAVVLAVILCKRRREQEPNDPDDEEIMPYATIHISGISTPSAEHNRCRLPGTRNSPYENIDHLGRPFANPPQYLFFQPRYENEADNGVSDVLLIKPGYDKLTPDTRRKRRENSVPFARSPFGSVDKSGVPVYDSIIRETELKCCNGRLDISESEDENRDIHTIMEVPSCDERSQADTIEELLSGGEDTDDTISLQD